MTDPAAPLRPGQTIGILGGGQLGRMLSLAAASLGLKTHVFCPDPESPAFEVTPHKTVAAYEDAAALEAFAGAVDVVTYEFENVPLATATILARQKPLFPGARALEVAQDRLAEKRFLTGAGIPVAPFRAVDTREDLARAAAELGLPAVLKTTRLGYDGKGQKTLRVEDDLGTAFEKLGGVPLVLEAFIPFDKEISVIVARGRDGAVAAYEPAENVHRDHILKTSTVPAAIAPAIRDKALATAGAIVSALDYVGVMGVEFFVLGADGLLVNEIAPRVHNSGHWTQAVCPVDQFDNHIRAVSGWPLGTTAHTAAAMMENLIGPEADLVLATLRPGDQLHLYGKREARPGRKMGHINRAALPKNPV